MTNWRKYLSFFKNCKNCFWNLTVAIYLPKTGVCAIWGHRQEQNNSRGGDFMQKMHVKKLRTDCLLTIRRSSKYLGQPSPALPWHIFTASTSTNCRCGRSNGNRKTRYRHKKMSDGLWWENGVAAAAAVGSPSIALVGGLSRTTSCRQLYNVQLFMSLVFCRGHAKHACSSETLLTCWETK